MGRNKKVTVEGNTISGTAEDITDVLEKASQRVNKKYSRIQIKKAKIKDGLFLEVEYEEQVNDGSNKVKKDSTAPVHDDLKNAYAQLNAHLRDLCEQNEDCACKGFTIGGSGDHEGCVLIGTRDVEFGTLNLVSPL